MKKPMKRPVQTVLMGVAAVLMALFSLWNIRLLERPVSHLLRRTTGFSEFVEEVQSAYTSSIWGKYNFVNLNGWFASVLGQQECNQVVKLNNGMLTNTLPAFDTTPYAERVLELSAHLRDEGIDLLFICAPFKIDLNKTLLPEYIEDCSNENANMLLERLRAGGVNVLDLRETLSATPEAVDENFFRTDHHWNYWGAFLGFQQIARELDRLFPEREFDLTYADPELWEPHELKNWFLGSHGKRVGVYYGGTDDAVYYTPKFPTNISCAVPSAFHFGKGDFTDVNIFEPEFLQERDLFNNNPSTLYLGENYALTQQRNPDAPNDLRILWIRDSFSRPPLAYLSTLFREIDSIDPRDERWFGIAEYIDNFRPDIAVIMLYPRSMGTATAAVNFDYGTAQAAAKDLNVHKPVLPARDVRIPAGESYVSVPLRLERGQSYLFECDDIEQNRPGSGGAAVGLYDSGEKVFIATGLFDVEYDRQNGGFRWFFTVPEDAGEALELRLCAGMPDEPGGGVYRGVRLDAVG